MEGKLSVVVADDNERIISLLSDLLKTDEDINVVGTAKNGQEAYDIIRKEKPDVVLLDIIMPKLDGLSVMEKINKDSTLDKHPAFVVMSAVGQEAITEDAFSLGANYFIMKPFDGEALVKRVKRLKGTSSTQVSGVVYERGAKEFDMEQLIVNLLRDIGVPLRMVGYKYLKDAILIALKDSDALMSITKNVYPEIASKHETSSGNVERNIRYVIESTWSRRNDKKYEKAVELIFKDSTKKPTNSEFILVCSETIHFQMK